ncbi:MAG: peptidylprolyl isomerase, partial [Bacteroidales bacterium]|nr:peptidylprolyl isomerase [Bacteroidales bacterium]
GDPFTRDTAKVAQYGTGGPGYTIPAEIVPGKTHKKGALAAARLADRVNPAKESSGSQFYIVQDPANCVHLDGEYTIFGEVVDGLPVIDKIAAERTDRYDRPVGDVKIISITPL